MPPKKAPKFMGPPKPGEPRRGPGNNKGGYPTPSKKKKKGK